MKKVQGLLKCAGIMALSLIVAGTTIIPGTYADAATVSNTAVGYGADATGGGSTATIEVSTRDELISALKGTKNKVILLKNDINLCVDSNGKEFTPGQTDTSGMKWTSGKEMSKDVILRVRSNTTILGKEPGTSGAGKKIYGGGLKVGNDASNVVLRYIDFEDAYDFFPEWDSDGSEWNTELDNLVVDGAQDVWIDHCTFSDGDNIETAQDCKNQSTPIHHDGLLDVKNGADNVTISNSVFKDHMKALLFGSSDNNESVDGGKMHVTMCNNVFQDIRERIPRLRFGQVHAFNNYFKETEENHMHYAFGLAKKSTLYAENNIFDTIDADVYRVMNSGTPDYYYQEAGSIQNGEVVSAGTYGASKPAYASSAKPSYSYKSTKVTTSNYASVAKNIVNNAGHTK